MIELSEDDRAKAEELAAIFREGSDVPPETEFEARTREKGGPGAFLGLRVSGNVALTPSDSGLAQATRKSSLPIDTRELSIQGNKYLLFARPPVEKVVHNPSLANHLAMQMATKFEKGCEGPIFAEVRPGTKEIGWVQPDRTYLVLDRALSEEEGIFERGKYPLEERTIGGKNYVLYGCREITLRHHPVLKKRARKAREKFLKVFGEALKNHDPTPEEKRKETLHQVASQLGFGDAGEGGPND